MIKKVRIISLILILVSLGIIIYFESIKKYDVYVQNRIIDNVFSIDVSDNSSVGSTQYSNNSLSINDYLGYISIPKFNVKRLIMNNTDSDILNASYVGMHGLSGDLESDDLIILAGHNVSNVFHKLHSISIGDVVYIQTFNVLREFIVYDIRIVNEHDFSSLVSNRKNELLLITCTKHNGERLLVFLKEVL